MIDYISDPRSSYAKTAKKFDVPLRTITARAINENWYEQKKKKCSELVAKAVDKTIEERSNNIAESATIISRLTLKLLKQMSKEVAQRKFDSERAEYHKNAAVALDRYAKVVGVKNPKDVEEQEARIENLRRQNQSDSDKDKSIVVQFGNAEEYSK